MTDTIQAVQQQKMTKGLKFQIYKVEILYYLCSQNKGTDQLWGYRAVDLRLCFRICTKQVFLWLNSIRSEQILIFHNFQFYELFTLLFYEVILSNFLQADLCQTWLEWSDTLKIGFLETGLIQRISVLKENETSEMIKIM